MTEQGRTIKAHWDLNYEHAIGPTASHFFDSIKEKEKVLGKRCPECERVLVPPRSFCDRCFVETKDWVELGLEGVIESFTFVYQHFRGLPEPPYALAFVLLDGGDTAIGNFVRGVDLSDPKKAGSAIYIGRRVKTVFAPDRKGSVLDFWFEPV